MRPGVVSHRVSRPCIILSHVSNICVTSPDQPSVTNLSSVRQPQSSSGLGSWMEAFLRIFLLVDLLLVALQGRDNYIMSVWVDWQLSFSTWIIHGKNISKNRLLDNINKCWLVYIGWVCGLFLTSASDYFVWQFHSSPQSQVSQTGCDLSSVSASLCSWLILTRHTLLGSVMEVLPPQISTICHSSPLLLDAEHTRSISGSEEQFRDKG